MESLTFVNTFSLYDRILLLTRIPESFDLIDREIYNIIKSQQHYIEGEGGLQKFNHSYDLIIKHFIKNPDIQKIYSRKI